MWDSRADLYREIFSIRCHDRRALAMSRPLGQASFMSESAVPVLYILGTGRSGSTLVANSLGRAAGIISVGELHQIWQRGLIEKWYCGCGVRFSECAMWQDVLFDAFGASGVDPHVAVHRHRSVTRVRHVPLVLAAKWRPGLLSHRLGDHLEHLSSLYRSIRRVTGAEVIVDSSKSPSYASLLQMTSTIDLHILHLVRDPRGVAYSLRRNRARADAGSERAMDVVGPVKGSVLWATWNAMAEALALSVRDDRYLRVRYEDVVERPRELIARILGFLGRTGEALPFVDGRTIDLEKCHTVSGNPNRMRHGQVELRCDLEWMTSMRRRDRALVTAITAGGLLRYGYPLRRRLT
jgi:Sulfotransferase family